MTRSREVTYHIISGNTAKKSKPMEDVGSLWCVAGVRDSYLQPLLLDVSLVVVFVFGIFQKSFYNLGHSRKDSSVSDDQGLFARKIATEST